MAKTSSPSATPVVYVNGQFVAQEQAVIPIYDSALMFGDMAFEFSRTFGHQPFRLDQHLKRLYDSMDKLSIDPGISPTQMAKLTLQLIEKNKIGLHADADMQIMHEVSRGVLDPYQPIYAHLRQPNEPTIIIATHSLEPHLAAIAHFYTIGIKAVIPTQRAIAAHLLDPKMKTRSRQHYQLANLQAKQIDPAAYALLIDESGFLTEGTSCNLFIVKDNRVSTPKPDNILRGISRAKVMDMCKELAIPCKQCDLTPADMLQADEAFITSTRMCLLSLTHLDGQPIGQACCGPLAKRLLAHWSKQVGVDIAQQAQDAKQRQQ